MLLFVTIALTKLNYNSVNHFKLKNWNVGQLDNCSVPGQRGEFVSHLCYSLYIAGESGRKTTLTLSSDRLAATEEPLGASGRISPKRDLIYNRTLVGVIIVIVCWKSARS